MTDKCCYKAQKYKAVSQAQQKRFFSEDEECDENCEEEDYDFEPDEQDTDQLSFEEIDEQTQSPAENSEQQEDNKGPSALGNTD